MVTNASVFEVIESLSQSLPLDPAKVGELLSITLEPNPAVDSPVLTSYAQPAGENDSLYETVEVRVPHPLFGSGGGLLKVILKSDVGIDSKAILTQYGLEFKRDVPSPRHPPGLPVYYNYELPWGTLSLGVSNNEARKLVSFIMKPKKI